MRSRLAHCRFVGLTESICPSISASFDVLHVLNAGFWDGLSQTCLETGGGFGVVFCWALLDGYVNVFGCVLKECKEGGAKPEGECLYGSIHLEVIDHVVVTIMSVVTNEPYVYLMIGDGCGSEYDVAGVNGRVCFPATHKVEHNVSASNKGFFFDVSGLVVEHPCPVFYVSV